MWRRVDIVLTDVSEERIASIFRKKDNHLAGNQREQVLTMSWRSFRYSKPACEDIGQLL
jgi:hypothetical protein